MKIIYLILSVLKLHAEPPTSSCHGRPLGYQLPVASKVEHDDDETGVDQNLLNLQEASGAVAQQDDEFPQNKNLLSLQEMSAAALKRSSRMMKLP